MLESGRALISFQVVKVEQQGITFNSNIIVNAINKGLCECCTFLISGGTLISSLTITSPTTSLVLSPLYTGTLECPWLRTLVKVSSLMGVSLDIMKVCQMGVMALLATFVDNLKAPVRKEKAKHLFITFKLLFRK